MNLQAYSTDTGEIKATAHQFNDANIMVHLGYAGFLTLDLAEAQQLVDVVTAAIKVAGR